MPTFFFPEKALNAIWLEWQHSPSARLRKEVSQMSFGRLSEEKGFTVVWHMVSPWTIKGDTTKYHSIAFIGMVAH